jgi:hypothetical protein
MESNEKEPILNKKIGDFALKKPKKIWLWYLLTGVFLILFSFLA